MQHCPMNGFIIIYHTIFSRACNARDKLNVNDDRNRRNVDRGGRMFKRKNRNTNYSSSAFSSTSETSKATVGFNNYSGNLRLSDNSLFYIR